MNALTKAAPSPLALQPRTFDELVRYTELIANSDLMPKDYKGKPANIFLAVQMGAEVGLTAMQAIQNIAIIGGRPSVWGDAMLGLCQASPHFEDIAEEITGEGDAMHARCAVKRRGRTPVERTFSVAEAKHAGLWGKTGPWQAYPRRMLQMRARAFALRDTFPDVLRGLNSAEEMQDTPAEPFRGTTIDGSAERREWAATPESKPDAPAAEGKPADPPPESTPRKGRKIGDIVDAVRAAVVAARTVREVLAIGDGADVAALMKHANANVQAEVKALLAEAYADAERREAQEDDAAEAEIEGDELTPDDTVPPFDEPLRGEGLAHG